MTTRIKSSARLVPNYRVGIGGNIYVYGLDFYSVQRVCLVIDKSPNAIKSHPKHNVWYVRLKSKKHKQALREQLELHDGRLDLVWPIPHW